MNFIKEIVFLITRDLLEGVEAVEGISGIYKITSESKIKGAGKKLDEGYLMEELNNRGLDIPIYMSTMDMTVGEAAENLNKFIKKIAGKSSVSMEIYEHGGDSVAGMHAGHKNTIVSPVNEKYSLMVAAKLKEQFPELDIWFSLTGLGNDYESYHKWLNEVVRLLLKTCVTDIITPWRYFN